MLYREPKLLKGLDEDTHRILVGLVSVLYREPKLLKDVLESLRYGWGNVSVLYREPKLLKEVLSVRCV